MVYDYLCPKCELRFDVVKPAAQYNSEEVCQRCSAVAVRQFSSRLQLSQTRVQEAEYNPGLGCIVRDRQHRAEICKQRGLEEIGNEKPDTIHKHFDAAREQKRERAWAEATKGWVGDGT